MVADVNSRILFRSAAAVLLLTTVIALLPAAAAGQPEPLGFNPDGLNVPATDVGIDDAGLYGATVIQTQASLGGASPSDRPNIFTYRIQDETPHREFFSGNVSAESYDEKLAVPTGGDGGAENFAVTGPDGRITVYNRSLQQSDNPVVNDPNTEFRATDIDIGKNGHWIVVPLNDVGQAESGKFTVLSVEGGEVSSGPKSDGLTSRPTASEIAPQVDGEKGVAAVGTALNGVKFYFKPRDPETGNTFSRSTNEVSDITMSGDGEYAAVGTLSEAGGSAGAVYFFGREAADGGGFSDSYVQYVSRFSDPRTSVTETAITADGQYVAAGTADGRVRFLENRFPDDPGRHSARVGATWEHPSGAAVDDLAVSNDGTYFVAAAGGSMWGFTEDTGEVLWTVSVPEGRIEHVDVNGQGDRFIAAANDGGEGYTYGWKHQRDVDVDVTPDQPETKPLETVSVNVSATNTGSTVDTYSFLMSPPSNWGYQPTEVTRDTLPGRSANFTLNLTPPESVPPGVYSTTIRVSSQQQGEVIHKAFVNTTIQRVHDINITTENKSVAVDAGTRSVVPFEVDNNGNDRSYVNVTDIRQSHSTGQSWNVQVEEWDIDDPIQIPRGGSQPLTLSVRPPGDAVDGDYDRITVILEDGGSTDTFNVTARVNPQFDFTSSLRQDSIELEPDEEKKVEIIVRNRGNTLDTVRINRTVTPPDVRDHWEVSIPPGKGNLTLGRDESKSVLATVRANVQDPQPATIRFDLDSEGAASQRLTLQVQQPPDDDDDGFPVPGPSLGAAVAATTLAALARRRHRAPPPGG